MHGEGTCAARSLVAALSLSGRRHLAPTILLLPPTSRRLPQFSTHRASETRPNGSTVMLSPFSYAFPARKEKITTIYFDGWIPVVYVAKRPWRSRNCCNAFTTVI